MKVIAQDNDTIDALCWRHLGRTAGVVEETLKINGNISRKGIFLKAGTVVELPSLSKKEAPVQSVKLWG